MGGLSVFYASFRNNLVFLLTSFLYLFSLLSTFSAGALASIVITLFLLFTILLVKFICAQNFSLKKLPLFVSVLSLMSIFLLAILFHDVGPLLKLVEFSQGVDQGRLGYWTYALNQSFSNNLLPFGLGSSGSQDLRIVNTYLLILYDLGIIGFLLYILYPLQILFNIIRRHRSLNPLHFPILTFVLISSFASQLSFSTFYYPYALVAAVLITEFLLFCDSRSGVDV